MPRPKGYAQYTKPIPIRLDEETHAFYHEQAKIRRMSLSEYLRNTLVQGVIAESAADIEDRLRALMLEISAPPSVAVPAEIPDSLKLSIYTSEALLAAIVSARDLQELYAAQDKAKRRLEREKVQELSEPAQ